MLSKLILPTAFALNLIQLDSTLQLVQLMHLSLCGMQMKLLVFVLSPGELTLSPLGKENLLKLSTFQTRLAS